MQQKQGRLHQQRPSSSSTRPPPFGPPGPPPPPPPAPVQLETKGLAYSYSNPKKISLTDQVRVNLKGRGQGCSRADGRRQRPAAGRRQPRAACAAHKSPLAQATLCLCASTSPFQPPPANDAGLCAGRAAVPRRRGARRAGCHCRHPNRGCGGAAGAEAARFCRAASSRLQGGGCHCLLHFANPTLPLLLQTLFPAMCFPQPPGPMLFQLEAAGPGAAAAAAVAAGVPEGVLPAAALQAGRRLPVQQQRRAPSPPPALPWGQPAAAATAARGAVAARGVATARYEYEEELAAAGAEADYFSLSLAERLQRQQQPPAAAARPAGRPAVRGSQDGPLAGHGAGARAAAAAAPAGPASPDGVINLLSDEESPMPRAALRQPAAAAAAAAHAAAAANVPDEQVAAMVGMGFSDLKARRVRLRARGRHRRRCTARSGSPICKCPCMQPTQPACVCSCWRLSSPTAPHPAAAPGPPCPARTLQALRQSLSETGLPDIGRAVELAELLNSDEEAADEEEEALVAAEQRWQQQQQQQQLGGGRQSAPAVALLPAAQQPCSGAAAAAAAAALVRFESGSGQQQQQRPQRGWEQPPPPGRQGSGALPGASAATTAVLSQQQQQQRQQQRGPVCGRGHICGVQEQQAQLEASQRQGSGGGGDDPLDVDAFLSRLDSQRQGGSSGELGGGGSQLLRSHSGSGGAEPAATGGDSIRQPSGELRLPPLPPGRRFVDEYEASSQERKLHRGWWEECRQTAHACCTAHARCTSLLHVYVNLRCAVSRPTPPLPQVVMLVDGREVYRRNAGQGRASALDTHITAVGARLRVGSQGQPRSSFQSLTTRCRLRHTCVFTRPCALPRCLCCQAQMRKSGLAVEERHLPIGDTVWVARSRWVGREWRGDFIRRHLHSS